MSEHFEATEDNNLTSVSIRTIDIEKEDDELSPEYSPNGRYRNLNILLGSGTFKNVYKAIDEEEGKEVAWNSLLIKDYETAQEERVTYLEEIKLLKSISHPNIIELYDFWFTDNNFVFITELMTSGTLRDYVRNVKNMNIKIIRRWSKQILEGILYLHSLNPMIIHRDIKCENIFVNGAKGIVKIGDLGIAKKKDIKRYTMVGTPEFMAREIFEGDGYSEKVDVYAFGMCLLEMATGKSPYYELKSTAHVFRNVLKGILPEGLKLVKDGCLKSLILRCINSESVRPCIKECLEHHFFLQCSDCDGKCFEQENIPSVTQKDIEMAMRYGPSNIVRCQMYFNNDTRYITFKYNPDFDTPEAVSQEMVDQGLINAEIRKTISDLISKALVDLGSKLGTRVVSVTSIFGKKSGEGDVKGTMVGGNVQDSNVVESAIDMVASENKYASPEYTSGALNYDSGVLDDPHADSQAAKPDLIIQASSPSLYSTQSDTNHSYCSVAESSDKSPYGLKDSEMPLSPRDNARISDSPELSKVNFPDTMTIEELATEVATITKRDDKTVKDWIEAFKLADIDTTGDLRILTEEDWNSLSLTVFCTRTIKNILFGRYSQPLLEKDLIHNKNIKEYDDDLSIKELLEKVLSPKKEAIKRCEDRLRLQDLRTTGELRTLHEKDWSKLGLTILSTRALKNSVTRRGKSLECGMVVH